VQAAAELNLLHLLLDLRLAQQHISSHTCSIAMISCWVVVLLQTRFD
jgi:hypothetical protein